MELQLEIESFHLLNNTKEDQLLTSMPLDTVTTHLQAQTSLSNYHLSC